MSEQATSGSGLVRVREAWNGWRTAEVPLLLLRDVCWRQPPGGPRPMLHASVMCSDIVSGVIPHPCEEGASPHDVQVWIVKCDVPEPLYHALARQAEASARTPRGTMTATAAAIDDKWSLGWLLRRGAWQSRRRSM